MVITRQSAITEEEEEGSGLCLMASAVAQVRIPRGVAKRIVQSMKPGDTCVIRPNFRFSFRKAARQIGYRTMEHAFFTPAGEKRLRLTLLRTKDWRSGHIFQCMPARVYDTGRFVPNAT